MVVWRSYFSADMHWTMYLGKIRHTHIQFAMKIYQQQQNKTNLTATAKTVVTESSNTHMSIGYIHYIYMSIRRWIVAFASSHLCALRTEPAHITHDILLVKRISKKIPKAATSPLCDRKQRLCQQDFFPISLLFPLHAFTEIQPIFVNALRCKWTQHSSRPLVTFFTSHNRCQKLTCV